MRIAYLSADPGVPVFGRKGCSIHVQEVLRAFRRLGADVHLFACRFDGAPPLDLADVPVHALDPAPKGHPAAREQLALRSNETTAARLAAAGPFDLVYERYSLWCDAGMPYAAATATPGILEVNAPLIDEQSAHRALVDRASAERIAHRVFSAATAVIAVSREVARYVETFPGATARVHTVPNGVAVERYHPRPQSRSAAGRPQPFTIGFSGSMKPWHGLPTLVEAFARFRDATPNARLLLVGGGPGADDVTADLDRRGLAPHVELTGAVPHEAVPALLARMDAATAPYPPLDHFYFSPLKLYEYMAAGLPIVASAIGDIPEILGHGAYGLLVPPGDPHALADALHRLRRDPALAAALARAARSRALEAHSWQTVAERILTLAGLTAAAKAS